MAATRSVAEREQTASRLLASSAQHYYEPELDIDWQAPLEPDLPFLPLHRCSLYGTRLWRGLTHEQQVELSKHEMAAVLGAGIWFELSLIQQLVRHSIDRNPTAGHVQYALTEIGDETRHSVMFAKTIARMGLEDYHYGPNRWIRRKAALFNALARGPMVFAGAVIVEEILDRIQREAMVDDGVQPIIRMTSRIHVLEEARHVRFARDELRRTVPQLTRRQLSWHRTLAAQSAFEMSRAMIDPRMYASVGLDPQEATSVAWHNPHRRETMRWAGERVVAFLREIGMVGGTSQRYWRAAGLM